MKCPSLNIYILLCLLALFCLIGIGYGYKDGKASDKYSKNVNQKEKDSYEAPDDIRYLKEMKTPLRMGKLNLLWQKAIQRLSSPKLKKLLGELRVQDKEELTLKRIKNEGGDKDGIQEAVLRKKLLGIMKNYSLADHFQDENTDPSRGISDHKITKALFTDKRLNKLWDKAAQSGFSDEEFKALKEEFYHHQDKVDQFNSLVDMHHQTVGQDMNTLDNDVAYYGYNELNSSDKDEAHPTNLIREKHKDIKKSFDRLHQISSVGPESKEFVEPKVAGLWRLAVSADFTPQELESLHFELKHYESRLLKLRHLSGQLDLKELNSNRDEKIESNHIQGQNFIEERLSKQKQKVEKQHEDLELKIMARHSEL